MNKQLKKKTFNLKNGGYKSQKGITLIALIITIIVLLILAGISITMLSGDNSLLKRAGEARDNTAKKSLKEEAQVLMLGRQIDVSTKAGYNKTIKDEIEESIKDATVEPIEGYTDVYYVKKGNDYITVYEDGEIQEGKAEIWNGEKISCPVFKQENNVWNWYIYTPSQLKFLADFVNNGNALTEEQQELINEEKKYDPNNITIITENITETNVTRVFLMNDLDLGGRIGETGTTEEQKWENNVANNDLIWIPIGDDSNQFKAKFEGNNYTVRGVYIKQTDNYAGIFGYSSDINYLTVKNSYIHGAAGVGGIVGYSTGKINNCNNENTTVIASGYAGGISGIAFSTITNCNNSGSITGTAYYVGGIAGYVSGTITGCKNNGTVKGDDLFVGGIAGLISSDGTVKGCSNTGTIKGENGRSGGIVGYLSQSSSVSECNNKGAVEGKEYIGGIVGYASASTSIVSCTNQANITGTAGTGGNGIGGIVGHAAYIIKLCCNTGNVSGIGNSATGGICGRCVSGKGQDISLCYNSGEIKGDGLIGGISGVFGSSNADPSGKEYNCYNKGNLINTEGLNKVGGIAGSMSFGANITNCYYLSGKGATIGVTNIGTGGDLEAQNREAKSTDVDLKTFEEFLEWIEEHQ